MFLYSGLKLKSEKRNHVQLIVFFITLISIILTLTYRIDSVESSVLHRYEIISDIHQSTSDLTTVYPTQYSPHNIIALIYLSHGWIGLSCAIFLLVQIFTRTLRTAAIERRRILIPAMTYLVGFSLAHPISPIIVLMTFYLLMKD